MAALVVEMLIKFETLALLVRVFIRIASCNASVMKALVLKLNGYDFKLSTRENCASSQDVTITSEFADARALLDSTHHGFYIKSRQEWQDRLIKSMFCEQESTGSPLPWLIFTCGSMGSGKSFVRRWMSENDYLVKWNRVLVLDPDEIKHKMPEWQGHLAHNVSTAGSCCHEESVLLQEIALFRATANSLDVCVDGSLRDWLWYKDVFLGIRKMHPQYRIAIVAVHVERETASRRCKHRFAREGRAIPQNVFESSLNATSISLGILGPMADAVIHVSNNVDDEDPVIIQSEATVRGTKIQRG